MSATSTPQDIDSLFKLPLGEFTSARNALATQLKKDGRPAEASEAKALTKPSASAWAVNQLYWRHRQSFDRLIDTGERLRRAQATGKDARDANNARREVLGELTAIATNLLQDEGHSATRDLLRQVAATLEALSSYGQLPGAPAAGRLIDDLEPPGFDAVAGLLPASGKRTAGGGQIAMGFAREPAMAKRSSVAKPAAGSSRRDDELRKRRIAAAKAEVGEAQRALSAARKQAERAAAKRETAAARAKETETERARLEKQLARAAKDAAAAHALAEETAAQLDEATRAAENAERELEDARERLQRMTEEEGLVPPRATRPTAR